MTISQLKYILAVAKFQNFTKAAGSCFVTQPTLSMQIQKLEDELDIKIFDRSKKPLQVTKIGEKIIEQAKSIVDESNRMQDIIEQEKGFIGGLFTIGIIPTVMPTLLPMFLKTFMKRYPKVKLEVLELTTKDIIQKLKDGHIDAAIAATPLEVDFLVEKPLYYEPFVGFVPENHRLFDKKTLVAADLNLDDILLLEDGHCFSDNIINLCATFKDSDTEKVSIQAGNFQTLTALAKDGFGMTLLPYLNTLEMAQSDKKYLRHFVKPEPAREISLLHNKSQLKIQLINVLKDTISGVIRGAISFYDVKLISPLKQK
jgi:LysR family hydrogen peroxide-inducible transcriptional activator